MEHGDFFILIIAIPVVLYLTFAVGRAYESSKREKERDRLAWEATYRAMPDGEKLILQIETLGAEGEIKRLLEIVPPDFARASDGITPIIATMRFTGQTHFMDNSWRRWQILREIYRRLPKDQFVQLLNARDNKGWTALMYAAEESDNNAGSLLIHLGADPNIKNNAGETAADIARKWPSSVPVFEGRTVTPAFPNLLSEWENT